MLNVPRHRTVYVVSVVGSLQKYLSLVILLMFLWTKYIYVNVSIHSSFFASKTLVLKINVTSVVHCDRNIYIYISFVYVHLCAEVWFISVIVLFGENVLLVSS